MLVGAGPVPNADSIRAVLNGRLHLQVLQSGLLARNNHIYVMPAAQAMISHREQAVRVRRQVDANYVRFLVDHMIDEPWILMAEAVVVLPPHVRGQQIIQGCDPTPPFDVPRHLQPLGVLIEHGINNVDESFVTRKQAVPPGQQITLEPSLAHVFAKHLDHASIGRKMLVNIENLLHPHLVGSFQ